MSFQEIIGHEAAIASLKRAFIAKRVSHAYLFVGPEGAGKRKTASVFARLLVCGASHNAESCGTCDSCRRVDGGTHPDVFWIEPEGAFVKIDAVREASRRLSLKSFEGGRKVLVIADASSFNDESANALLKTLEEPADDTVLILLTQALSMVLPTIVSRCQRVFFLPLGESDIVSVLRTRYGLDAREALFLARFSEGSLGMALRYHESGLFARKNKLISDVLNRQSLLEEKEAAGDEFFSVLSSWFRDALLVKTAPGMRDFVHCDQEEALRRLAHSLTPEEIAGCLEAVAEARAERERNANFKISMAKLRTRLWMR